MKKTLFLALALSLALQSNAQSLSEKYERFLTEPYGYVAYRANGPIKVDGVLDEADWEKAPAITQFDDISGEGFPKPKFRTEARIMWDDNNLYIGAMLYEPNVWGDITQHDAVIYYNPDFEVFIDPDDDGTNYFEIEANPLATVFDLFVQKPYRARTRAFVTFSWDTPGLKLDTHVYGTLNDARDTDKGWSVEMAIPREAIAAEFDNYLKAGNYLRLGMSRVEWQTEVDAQGKTSRKKDAEGKYLPEDNWTWPQTGMIAFHMPERWGYVYLSDRSVGERKDEFKYPEYRSIDRLLWTMFYEQEKQFEQNGKYLNNLKQFKLTKEELAQMPEGATLKVEAISNKYEITVTRKDGSSVSIDEEGRVVRRANK